MRRTYKHLYTRIDGINERFKTNYRIESYSGMPGRHIRITTNGGVRDVSPRLSVKEMHDWLDGFTACITELQNDNFLK